MVIIMATQVDLTTLKPFSFDIIDDNTPMKEDNFSKWLNAQDQRMTNKTDSICQYLDSLGFIAGEHKIKPEEWKRLGYIFECYCTAWKPFKNVMSFGDIFEETNKPITDWQNKDILNPVFSFSKYSKLPTGVYKIKDDILSIIEDNISLVYPLNNYNYYFEVIETINGETQLFIKYQLIIGSRRICNIKL